MFIRIKIYVNLIISKFSTLGSLSWRFGYLFFNCTLRIRAIVMCNQSKSSQASMPSILARMSLDLYF